MIIKTRFAPSPTGFVHVGSLRTALYCYLFARKNNGKFVLRIEDTDQKRYVEEAEENLLHTLKWAGLECDEGPYITEKGEILEKGALGPYTQSKRTEIYQKHAEILLKEGRAYRCFCTAERLDEMRKKQIENREAPMYDRKCLDLPESEIEEKIKNGEEYVIRQKIPYENIRFKDLIRGNVQFDGKTIDDQILVKSDGFPTYHLANVVDDHLMEITHVIRGEEWLPSTPKHIALYNAFGWTPPKFAHLPLLLNEDKTKLSKRQGHVAVEEYIKEGYLREAVINFVAFLGWNPGGGEEKEIYTLKELEEIFSLEKVHKAGAVFNIEKLDWFNWRHRKHNFTEEIKALAKKTDPDVKIEEPRKEQFKYIFEKPEKEKEFIDKRGEKILKICEKYIPDDYKKDLDRLKKIVVTVEEKILKNPKEVIEHIDFYFALTDYKKELLTHEKMDVDFNRAGKSLEGAKAALVSIKEWTPENLEKTLLETVDKMGVKNGQVFWPLRSALSGLQFSPGVFELAWALGKEETINRIQIALNKL